MASLQKIAPDPTEDQISVSSSSSPFDDEEPVNSSSILGRRGSRRGSISDDIKNIVGHIGSKGVWSKLKALEFTVAYFVLGTGCAVLAFLKGDASMIALNAISGALQVLFIYSAFVSNLRCQVFENNFANIIFVSFVVAVGCFNFLIWSIGDIRSLASHCGWENYYKVLLEEGKINVPSLLGNLALPVYTFTLYFAWEKRAKQLEEDKYNQLVAMMKAKPEKSTANKSSITEDEYYKEDMDGLSGISLADYRKIYDSVSIRRFFVGGIIFTTAGSLACDMAILERSTQNAFFSLTFLALLFVNFVLDSSFMRKRRGLRRTRLSPAYLYTSCTTLVVALTALTRLREFMEKEHGAIPTMIALNLFGVVLIFLWETMAFKAATTATSGPVLFPLYFVTDVVSTYLFIQVEYLSLEFWFLLFTQEILGAFRNVGCYEIGYWVLKKLFGIEATFPLNDLHVLEELITIAAVDTVAEALAAFSFFSVLAGAKVAGVDSIACLFEPTSPTCNEQSANLGAMTLTMGIVILSRVVFFLLERSLFRYCVESVARTKSSAVVLEDGVQKLKKSVGRISRPSSGKLHYHLLKTSVKTGVKNKVQRVHQENEDASVSNAEALGDARAYIIDALQANANDWNVVSFSTLSNTSVHRYNANEKISSCPWKKETLTFRASVLLENASIRAIVEHDLDFLKKEEEKKGVTREILDAGDVNTLDRQRTLYQYVRTPAGMWDTDAVIVDKVEMLSSTEAILYACPSTSKEKLEMEKVYRNRNFVYGMHYKDVSPPGMREGSLSRVTYVMSIDESSTGIIPIWYVSKRIARLVQQYCDAKAATFQFVEEDVVRTHVNRMLENVDAHNVVGKVFSGSIHYLVCACVLVIAIVCSNGRRERAIFVNNEFWNMSKGELDIEEMIGSNSSVVNCSGVLFFKD